MSKIAKAAFGTSLLVLTAAPAFADGKLTLYTSQPNADAQATVDAFTAAHPDIEVDWIRDGTTSLMTKLNAEIEAGDPQPDVLLIADTVTLEQMKRDGHLAMYQSPEAANYDAALYDAEGGYHSTKLITTGIVYNQQVEMQPASYADLADPELASLTIMPSPLYSGAALIHMSTLLQNGYDLSYYEALKAGGAVNSTGNGGSYKAVASGEEGYGVIVEFLALRAMADGAPVGFVFPEEGVSYVTEPVAIMAGADDMEAAQTFVDFLLSEEGQQLVVSQGYIPARDGLASPEGFPSRDALKLMTFDPAVALDTADENKAAFERIFGAQ